MASAGIRPDYSLERDGVPLSGWLWRLVDESRATRLAAGEALNAMERGLPSVHADLSKLESFPDFDAQERRFARGVRAALARPDFDTADFVRRLGAYRIALQNDWLERVSIQQQRDSAVDEKYERIAGRLVSKLDRAADEREKERLSERLARLTAIYACTACDSEDDPTAEAESMTSAGFAAHRVFELLDDELLAVPELIETLLRGNGLRQDAYRALERIGPPAVGFAPVLIEHLDRWATDGYERGHFTGSRALGRIGRGNVEVVDAMVRRLRSENPHLRRVAARVFEHLGDDVCGREEEIVALLEPLLHGREEHAAAISAFASVGRRMPRVCRRMIELAEPRPERPVTVERGWSEWTYDQTEHERGTAISAMRYLTLFPGECVPFLTDAIDTFEEYDGDEMDGGAAGRIAAVLAAFGADAAPAALPLASHLHDDVTELPHNILDALAAMGPAARAALPELTKRREQYWRDEEEPMPVLGDADVSKSDDPVGWTIQRVRGVASPEGGEP